MSRYGPPSSTDTPVWVKVGTCRRGQPRTPEVDVLAHPAVAVQRRQLADLACYGFVTAQSTTRANREPHCHICGRVEADCVAVRPGDDDHVFERFIDTAPRPTVQAALEVAS